MKIIIYCRVSDEDQNVDQQVEYCKKYAKSRGWDVVWTFKDKESGRKELMERPTFVKLIRTINGNTEDIFNMKFDAVLIYKVDRLSRNWYNENTIEMAFKNSDKTLYSATENVNLKTPDGLFMFRFLMMLAAREVEVMLERQAIGIARAKAEGKYKGGKKGRKGWSRKK